MRFFAILISLFLVSCGGEAFTAEALSVAPDAAGGTRDDAPNRAMGSGGRSVGTGDERAPERDVLADPWPVDVVVEPAPGDVVDAAAEHACVWPEPTGCPCINCFLIDRPDGTIGNIICCSGGTVPGGVGDMTVPGSLCGSGNYPSPHKTYCAGCETQPGGACK